jgi:dTDP-4-amino-4,6-dideoxygalactose transaminase
VTERISNQLVRLPFFNSMTESEQLRVVDTIKSFRERG